jgi:hypothetical protein
MLEVLTRTAKVKILQDIWSLFLIQSMLAFGRQAFLNAQTARMHFAASHTGEAIEIGTKENVFPA